MARTKRQVLPKQERCERREEQRDGFESDLDSDVPRKRRRVEKSGPTRAARDLARPPKAAAPPINGLLTPEASSLAEEEPRRDVFLFLKLPAELRLQIYRCALCRDEPLLLSLPKDVDDIAEENMLAPWPKPTGVALLRTCSLVYKEARQILYAENEFVLITSTSIATLATLHQRSRSLIKSVILTMQGHHEILDEFSDVVRLGLRYCWGLETLTINLGIGLPNFDHHGSIWANAFRILRWLPQGCKVVLKGNVNESVKRIVAEEGRMLVELDEVSYFRRQRQTSGRVSGSSFTPNQPVH